DVDWARLADASRRAALVCPIPLSPLGRYPDASEMRSLAAWLAESSERYVLVDAVYAYDFRTLVRVAAPLTDTGRAIVLFSCAKAWLMPSALGVAWASASLHAELRSRVTIRPSPKPSLASSWLAARPDLPGEQQRAFSREWRRLAPRIQAASPAWAPPETGYLSVVARPFEEILERYDVLAVPASVFGSSSRAHSVVSCLHDLVEHERAVR
ncbi:MAG: aminotransferase class I/II-fold pyridoxal phosphate-dependent enzyme, partial [Deltaproteobacteria bacterium]|nr:aminotransferase class I/II-fold pyridoxal phosphate-dependent enzyme [Deltaproteobacteria bacterium]